MDVYWPMNSSRLPGNRNDVVILSFTLTGETAVEISWPGYSSTDFAKGKLRALVLHHQHLRSKDISQTVFHLSATHTTPADSNSGDIAYSCCDRIRIRKGQGVDREALTKKQAIERKENTILKRKV